MEIKNGTLILVHNDFKLNDKGTWLAPLIRGALNADNKKKHLEKIYYNHCVSVLEINSVLWVFEAGYNKIKKRGEVIKTPLTQWLSKRKEDSYLIKNPDFNFNSVLYETRLINSLGKPYDFTSVLIHQPIRLITGKRLWTGNKGTRKFFCSKLSAYAYNYPGWEYVDPEDLIFSSFFI